MNNKTTFIFTLLAFLLFAVIWFFNSKIYTPKADIFYENIYDEVLHNDTGYITKISGNNLEIEIESEIYNGEISDKTEIIYYEPKDIDVLAGELQRSAELGIDPPSGSIKTIKTAKDLSIGMTIDIETENIINKDVLLIINRIVIN